MKHFLLFVLSSVRLLLNAQDTIYKHSGDVIPARVIEINTTEISYRRENLQDGPLFILTKNEVKKIKYKTGAIDSFTVNHEVPVKQLNPNVVVYTYNEQMQKARMKGTYFYHGHTISDTKAMLLVANKNATWKNPELEWEMLKVKKNRALQYTSSLGGLGLGFLVMGSTIMYSVNNPSNETLQPALFFNGLAVLIAAQAVSVHFKLKRVKHSDKAVNLYNQHL